ncbi:MAG: hypothetical protein CVV55_06860, partial [Synergistetes bacterium HGW-Synergistetes-2]
FCAGVCGDGWSAATWRRGAEVVLISGPSLEAAPVGVTLLHVESTAEMAEAVNSIARGTSDIVERLEGIRRSTMDAREAFESVTEQANTLLEGMEEMERQLGQFKV